MSSFVAALLLSYVQVLATPGIVAHQAFLSSTISCSLFKFTFIESVTLPNHLILCHPHLFAFNLSSRCFPIIKVFPNGSVLHIKWLKYWSLQSFIKVFSIIKVFSNHIKWPKCWSFSFSNSASNEYSGLTSFRIDWFDLLVAQGIFKSLL